MRNFVSKMKVALMLLCLFSLPALAQSQQTVTGTVLDAASKMPLAGVNVKVVGGSASAQTNEKGVFTIRANNGQSLQISYVGYEGKKVSVNGTNLAISLTPETSDLEDVVVTAMDIKRKPRELGYSVQKVGGKEIAESQRENFLNSLQGRVAGLTITPTGGQAGASTSLVLRGFNSMALSNQPLYVVDGVIVDNGSINEAGGGATIGLASDQPNRNQDYSNRIADINPNDIESVTILKGPEATALYGSQASSGAIVITTKKAKATGRITVNYDNSFRIQRLTRIPDVTNKFSQGNNGISNENVFTYFGPAYGADVPMFDNIGDFFKTGFAQTHNISAEYGTQKSSWRFSASAFDQNGVVPNNEYARYTLRLSNATKINKYIDIAPSITYTRTTNWKPQRGAGSYLMNLLTWPPSNNASKYLDDNGFKFRIADDEFDNPFYNANFNRGYDVNDRFLMTLGVNINPFPWLAISGRFGYDTYKNDGFSIMDSASSARLPTTFGGGIARTAKGFQDNFYRNYKGYNHVITATARKSVGNFNGRVMVGTMWQDYRTDMYAVSGSGLKGNYLSGMDSNNTNPATRIRLNNAMRKGGPNYFMSRQAAYFGEFALNYKNLAFFTYSHRFEESSIFPKNYRSYNYPAGSVSFIMSDILPFLKNDVLSYFKLRGSLAQTARSSAPYANQSVFNFVTSSGGGYAYGFSNNNYFLEPELQKTYEIGAELKLFNNKVNLDFTYYNTLNEKQIAENFRASYGTGFVLNTLNVGSTRNTGIEIALDATPVNTKDFSWSTRINFNKMKNKVLSLPDNVPEFYISDTWVYGNARGGLITGGPSTSITGFGYQRNDKGQILIEPTTGLPLVDQTFRIRGDRNPDFSIGFNNNFRYKNFTLSFLWDLKVGGDVFNANEMFLTIRGRSLRTEDRREARVIEGVLNDGLQNSANPTKNTIAITPYNLQSYYTARMPEEEFIERDVNWLRLRDITLGYTLPAKAIRKLSFLKSLSFFATGNDLILLTNYTGADPATSANTSASRGVGGFGFDYGNIATPISVNIGLRAGF